MSEPVMHDHPKYNVKDGRDACLQSDAQLEPETDDPGGPSNGKGKTGMRTQPSSRSGEDEDAQLNSDLVSAWTQRLQVLTVVTTFLATIDGQLFSLTALQTQIGVPVSTSAREVVYACLAGALIFHVCATILGYIASFALIRYRIVDASSEEDGKVGGILCSLPGSATTQPGQRSSRKIVLEAVRPAHWIVTFLPRPKRLRFLSISQSSSPPPLSLLTRCYYTTLFLASVGFILALTGILAYIWAGLRMPVGIFSSVCLGVGVGAGVWAVSM